MTGGCQWGYNVRDGVAELKGRRKEERREGVSVPVRGVGMEGDVVVTHKDGKDSDPSRRRH